MKKRILIYLIAVMVVTTAIYRSRSLDYKAKLAAVTESLPDGEKYGALADLSKQEGSELLDRLGYGRGFWIDGGYLVTVSTAAFVAGFGCLMMDGYYRKKEEADREDLISYLNRLESGEAELIHGLGDSGILYDRLFKVYNEVWASSVNAQHEKAEFRRNLDDIAHQLKTPITSMMIVAEGQGASEVIMEKLGRLDSLTDDLLRLSSLELGTNEMKTLRFRPSDACIEAYEYLEELFEFRSIEVTIEYSEVEIVGDYYWITEAFANILKNAALYLKGGERVLISVRESPISTSVIFEDNGDGLPQESIHKLFNRFYKSPDSNGFGLGLNIARSVAERNNGSLIAYNEGGAVFRFEFYKCHRDVSL